MTVFASLIKVSYDQLMYEEKLFHYQIIESVPWPTYDENKNSWQWNYGDKNYVEVIFDINFHFFFLFSEPLKVTVFITLYSLVFLHFKFFIYLKPKPELTIFGLTWSSYLFSLQTKKSKMQLWGKYFTITS